MAYKVFFPWFSDAEIYGYFTFQISSMKQVSGRWTLMDTKAAGEPEKVITEWTILVKKLLKEINPEVRKRALSPPWKAIYLFGHQQISITIKLGAGNPWVLGGILPQKSRGPDTGYKNPGSGFKRKLYLPIC